MKQMDAGRSEKDLDNLLIGVIVAVDVEAVAINELDRCRSLRE